MNELTISTLNCEVQLRLRGLSPLDERFAFLASNLVVCGSILECSRRGRGFYTLALLACAICGSPIAVCIATKKVVTAIERASTEVSCVASGVVVFRHHAPLLSDSPFQTISAGLQRVPLPAYG